MASNDDGGTGTNSRLDLTLEAGTYTIEATTYGSDVTGDFSLTISLAEELVFTLTTDPQADLHKVAELQAELETQEAELNQGNPSPPIEIPLLEMLRRVDHTAIFVVEPDDEDSDYDARFNLAVAGTENDVTVTITASAEKDITTLGSAGLFGSGYNEERDPEGSLTIRAVDLGSRAFIITGECLAEGGFAVIRIEGEDLHLVDEGAILCEPRVIGAMPEPPMLCIQALPRFSPLPGVSPIEGEWASDCLSEHQTGSYARYYSFALPATPPGSSTQVTVNLDADVDTYLYLLAGEGTDGRVIASNDNGPHRNTQSQINELLPGGAYTVEATTNQPAVAGAFFLTVSTITVTVPPPRIDSMGCTPLEVLVGETVACRPTLSGGEPTRYLWGAIGGNPWSGTGETFSTQWDTPGIKRIVFEACNDAGCDTGEQTITADAPAPPAVPLGDPTNLQASAAGAGQARLTWRPAAGAEVHWIWSVKVDGTGGKYTRASGTASTTTVVGLENGQNYWFITIAGRTVNGVQEWSQWSQWVNVRVSGTTVQVANDDRAALLALYHATGGPNWTNNQNWLSAAPLNQWYGVTADADGRVTRLKLPSNQLTGELPSELGGISSLVELELTWNDLSGQIPRELGNLYNLTRLDLLDNQLDGEIPSDLGDLAALEVLILGQNRSISGSIPPELGQLSNLEILHLSHNRLTGEIPVELGQLSNLKTLNLPANQLSGVIPPVIGSLANLEWVNLAGNRLSGEIPAALGNLGNLRRLFLGENRLSGDIPPELGNLVNLTHIHFAGNQLTGCVPSGLQDVEHNDFAALGIPFCAAAPVGSPPASQQAPDLVVTLTISDGGLLYSGATATATARIFNEGDATASDYTLRFYRSQDRRFTNNNVMSSVRPEDLPSSTNSIRRLGFTVPADEGDYYFAACVDGVPGESDTTNNCSDWTSASIFHPVTLTTSDCSTGHILGVVPDSTEISGTVLARRSVSQANVIWRVIDAFGNTNSSGIERLGSMSESEAKDFAISTAWGGLNNTCDLSLQWAY